MTLNSRVSSAIRVIEDQLRNYYGFSQNQLLGLLSKTFYAGGCINSIMSGSKVNDYDLFFTDTKVAKDIILYILSFNVNNKIDYNIEFTEDKKIPGLKIGKLVCKDLALLNLSLNRRNKEQYPTGICYVSENAITLNNGLQLIFRFVGSPEIILSETFDYDHYKIYFKKSPIDPVYGKVTILPEAAVAIAEKKLVYSQKSRFVLSAMARLHKFASKGWNIDPQTLINLLISTQKINLEDPIVFREELLGIYGVTPKQVSYILEQTVYNNKVDLNRAIKLVGEF